jgi:hypothetical protein
MELGQMLFGNPYSCPEYVKALVVDLLNDLEIHWGNEHICTPGCEEFTAIHNWEDVYDFSVGGITFKRYYWGDDEGEAAKPNLSFKGIEVRWYKYPMRSSTTNVKMKAYQWVRWYDAFKYELGSHDEDTVRYREREATRRAGLNGNENELK